MVLITPTAFKGTLGAAEVAAAMAAGARRALPDATLSEMPVSDGGPGLIESLRRAWGGRPETLRVTGPTGEPVRARVLRSRRTAVVETADACGLHLLRPGARDPLTVTTYGVGELIRAAARGEPERIILGLGGSGTVDGGAGMAQAVGWHLLDMDGRPIPRGGRGLVDLSRISRPTAALELPPVTALADVANPLLGDEGAAAVFGPQKGAPPAAVRRLELALARLAVRIEEDLGRDVRRLPGTGAAGGLGAGAVAFLDAELVRGSDWLLRAVDFAGALEDARLVVTGEGTYDEQTRMGKVVGAVIERARSSGTPVLLVAGALEAPAPDGVEAVDGGGEILTEQRIEALVAQHAPRLLAR